MELRRTSPRRAGLVAVAALLALGATACSGGTGLVGTPPAATVNGTQISSDTLMEEVALRHDFYKEQADKSGGATGELATVLDELTSSGGDTVGTAGAARTLSDLIADEVIRQDLAAHDALPTKQDRDDIRSQIEEQVGGAAALKKFDQAYIASVIESQALNQAFAKRAAAQANKALRPYTDDERTAMKDQFYEQNYSGLPLCLNLIQGQTQEAAAQAKARVDSGEDFVTVARATAGDAGATIPDVGAIVCLPVEQAATVFGQDLSKAAVGDVIGPLQVQAQAGALYVVVRVESLDGLTREEAEPLLDAQVPDQPDQADPASYDARAELNELIRKADVTVNPQFGRWSSARARIVPPAVPEDPTETTQPTGGSTTTTAPVAVVAGS